MRNNVEKMRKLRDLSQEQLGEALGVSRQTIISIEKGKYNPSLELAFRLGRFFQTPIEDIFIYEEDVK